MWLFGRRRQLYLLLPLGAIWLYALLSGLSASVERAAIMGTVYLGALALGRPRSVLPALALAAGVMAGLNPQVLRDVSFQLSFTAVAGIALLAPPLAQGIKAYARRVLGEGDLRALVERGLAEAVAVTVAATVATLPLIAFNFHRISVVGIPTTLLSLPALPLILVTSGVTALGRLAGPGVGQVVGWAAWAPLSYLIELVRFLSRLPGVSLATPGVSGLLVWGYYGLWAWLLLVPRRLRTPGSLWERLGVGLVRAREVAGAQPLSGRARLFLGLVLAALAFLLWTAALSTPDGRLHVLFLDVGQGDSILIVTSQGRQVLVDGGPDPGGAIRALGRHMPFWDRSLDLVVATHPQEDHLGGLVEVVKRYRVGKVLEGPLSPASSLYQQWQRLLDKKGVSVVPAFAGQRIELGEGLRLEVLNPPPQPLSGTSSDLNNNGVVMRLVYGEVSFLLTADVQEEAEALMASRGMPLKSTLLKVAHHGSETSTSPEFLTAVDPQVAIVSVGADNRFGHPSPEVVARLQEGVGQDRIYLTSERGTTEIITDGKRLWVKTERR